MVFHKRACRARQAFKHTLPQHKTAAYCCLQSLQPSDITGNVFLAMIWASLGRLLLPRGGYPEMCNSLLCSCRTLDALMDCPVLAHVNLSLVRPVFPLLFRAFSLSAPLLFCVLVLWLSQPSIYRITVDIGFFVGRLILFLWLAQPSVLRDISGS